MNFFPLTRHLLLKDLRHQRLWLALVWLLALLIPVAFHFANWMERNSQETCTLMTGALFGLMFLVIARLVLLDAPGRRFRFLTTRPAPWTALLAGKIMFIALFLLAPLLLAQLGVIYAMNIPATPWDAALVLVESALTAGALLAVVMLFSIFLRNAPVVFVFLFAGFVLVMFGAEFLTERGYHSGHIPRAIDYPLERSRTLVFYAAAIVAVGATAAFRYREKSPGKPLAVLALAGAIALAAWNFWPVDLTRVFAEKPAATGELTPEMRDKIKLTLTGEEGKDENSLGGYGMWNGIKYVDFNHQVSLQGVKPPYYAEMVNYRATATLKSGHTIESSSGDPDSHGGMGGVNDVLRQVTAGFTPKVAQAPNFWGTTSFQIFHYVPGEYANEDLSGAHISGTLTLEIRRVFVVKTLPFKPGGQLEMPRRRYTLTKADVAGGTVEFEIMKNSVVSELRGDFPGSGGWENLSWLVFNRARGECLSPQSSGGGYGGGEQFFSNTSIENGTLRWNTYDLDWKKEKEPIPGDWINGAEISFFSTEPCGRISFPYEIKSVDLPH